MSMHDRAAQFSPFAALVGYDDAVAETARLTDSRAVLTEDEMFELNANLNRLLDRLDEQPEISVTAYTFCPNGAKIQQMNNLNLLCRGVNHCMIFAGRNMMK